MREQRTSRPVPPAIPFALVGRPLEPGTVTHFRLVGDEWVEVFGPVREAAHSPHCACALCQMDTVVAMHGGENLY